RPTPLQRDVLPPRQSRSRAGPSIDAVAASIWQSGGTGRRPGGDAMMRSLALWIGLRYTRAKRRNHFISFISLVSMLGIVIGVTALITVISVMNGFESELRTRILGMVSHATISAADNQSGMADWQQAIDL